MLKIYIGFKESEYQSRFRYTTQLISSLKNLFPITASLEDKLIDYINNEIVKPCKASTKNLKFELDIGKLWSSSIVFNLTINYKLRAAFEHSPIIKLKYKEFATNYGIIQTINGCIILLLSYNSPKFINLKYSKTPTKLEFKILLDIICSNINESSNFEEIIFKDEVKYIDQVPFTKGLNNLGHSSFMNSVVQLIVNNPHIQAFFNTFSRIDKLEFNVNRYPLLNATLQLYLKLKLNRSTCNEVRLFKHIMRGYGPAFKDYMQHDPREVLQFFLEKLHKEFLLYFSGCHINNISLDKSDIDPIIAYQKLNNSYINNLFLGLSTTITECGFCGYSETSNYPITNLQLNIPQKNLTKLNITILPFNTNGSQFMYNLEISIDSSMSLHELKCDLSNLTLIPIRRLIIAREFSLDKACKELIPIEYENETIGDISYLNSDLYCFELSEYYTEGEWNYIFINQGLSQGNRFIHFGYSLLILPVVHHLKFEYFYDCLVNSIGRVINFSLNIEQDQEIEQQLKNPRSAFPMLVTEKTNAHYLKQEANIRCNRKSFDIFKINELNHRYNHESIVLPIQNETQFRAALPLVDGDNIVIKWSSEYFKQAFTNFMNYSDLPSYINVNEFKHSKYSPNFMLAPLNSLTSTPLSFITYVKDLYNGKIVDNVEQEHEITLEDCIKNYLKTKYFEPMENPILNWECNCCNSNNVQKRDQLSEFPPYLIISFNRFKSDEDDDSFNSDKNYKLVKYPFEFQFNEYDKWFNYSLIGVCDHFGSFGDGGHFTATCKNTWDSKWYNFNNNLVNLVDERNIVGSSSYILIYQRGDAVINNDSLEIDKLALKSKLLYSN